MAIAYVGGQVAGRTNAATAASVNYALSGGLAAVPAAGDLVIVTCVAGSAARNPAMAVTTPATWTALGQLNQPLQTADTSLDVSYKFMGGTPDTAVTIPGTANNADGEAYAIQVWRGVDPTTPMDATPVSAGGTGTGRPDPAAITPVTAGAVVVICGGGASGTGANYTAPANYTTNFLTANGADTTDAMVGMGYWTGWTSGAENPAAYTGGTTVAVDSWCSYTLALRPQPAAQALTPSLFTSATAAFYAATVAAGAVALTAALFTNSNSFHAATVTPGAVGVTVDLVTNSQAFYAPTVEQPSGAQDLTPTLYTNSSSFYAPTVAPGSVDVSPTLATNAQAFYAATVAPGSVGLTAARFDNAGSFYAPSVSVDGGPQALTAGLFSQSPAFYAATVAPGAVGLTAARYDNASAFYAPTVAGASAGTVGRLYKRRPYHIEVDGERQYFTDPEAALEALRELREQEKPKPKKLRKRWQLVQTPRETVLVSSPATQPALSRADLESLDWVRDHAPASAQLMRLIAEREDEDDIELLLLSI